MNGALVEVAQWRFVNIALGELGDVTHWRLVMSYHDAMLLRPNRDRESVSAGGHLPLKFVPYGKTYSTQLATTTYWNTTQ